MRRYLLETHILGDTKTRDQKDDYPLYLIDTWISENFTTPLITKIT